MQTEDNDGDGQSVILVAGDHLDQVPATHQNLITPSIRQVFADPLGHFRRITGSCPFPQMATWLRALLEEEDWELALHRGDPQEWTSAGFNWRSSKVRGAEITPSTGTAPKDLPATFHRYYSLVDRVAWMPFGCAGGLEGCKSHTPVSAIGVDYYGKDTDPAKTFIFGWSPGGDMLVYTKDDRSGWLSHENGQMHLLGKIEDTIEWIFAELLANRCPDFDYD